MEVKVEDSELEEPEIMEVPKEAEEPENVMVMRTVVQNIIVAKSVTHLRTAIDFFNNTLADKMEYFLEIKDIYHYFCIISETAIDETNLNLLIPSLNTFYERIIQLCYEWKCLWDHFEGDYRFFNFIQIIIKKLVLRINEKKSFESNVFDECIPLMCTSLLISVSTIHGIKEVIMISKPITDTIFKRKSDLPLNTEQWKRLISCLTYLANAWKQINDIDLNDDQSLSKFIVYYLDLFLGSNAFLSHISDKVIKCFGIEKNVDLERLFVDFQYQVCRHVLRLIDMNSNFENLDLLLHKTMSFFSIKSLPSELMRHIVPHFAIKCNDKTELFIKKISEIDNKKTSEVIKTYLPDIIRHMFYSNSFKASKSFDEIEKVIGFLSRISNFDIFYRIRIVSYDLVNSFLMRLSEDYNSTLEAITFVQYYRNFKESNETKDNKYRNLMHYKNNETELKNVLKEFFLGYVHKFDNLMQDNSVCLQEKMIAIKSFVVLIEFMDKESVDTYRVKLFSTIKLIISERFYGNKHFIKLSIDSMAVFVKRVDESYLSSQLLTISALILPLMHFWPNESSIIFKELIIKHKSNQLFQSSFKHLYFIPEINELKEVTEVLRPYISCGDKEEEICHQITLVVNNLNHENSRVQEFSLQELAKLLERHQKLIYKKCNNTKEFDFDDFVNHIITQLMVCLKSSNENVLRLAAECLGILGAIDPLKVDLEKVVISKEENSEKFLNFNERKFKIILIRRLYRAITTSTTTGNQYCASYALQEVIKIFTSMNDGFKIKDLPQELQDFCQLLTRSKYNAKNPSFSSEGLKSKPIFGSIPNMTYREWLSDWLTKLFKSYIFKFEKDMEDTEYNAISSLVSQSSSASDGFDLDLAKALSNHSIKSKVLVSCFQLVLRNTDIAQFLLPYIVITALKNATPDQKQLIVDEIKVIITTLTTDDFIFNEIGHFTSQTVFHIFDYFKIWYKNRIALHRRHCQTPRQLKTAKLRDREFKGVQYFLEGISNRELSQLAFKCNAFSRSLRYIEEYIKCNENQFQEEIPFFQKIFIRLEEPDSVEGCNSKRTPNNPTLNEMILTHEAMGQMQEALICCEKATALNPNDFECQQKYLQISMESFDQSAMVRTYGSGLILERPDWRPKLAPYVIEAVWRLGDWNLLERMLEQFDVKALNSFGAGIGDLFCSMIKKKDLNEFDDKVLNLRTSLVGPLKAAATEISGYVRGHKYIVDLHILDDINHIYNKLMTELNEDICSIEILEIKFNEVIDIWDKRIDLVRNTVKCQEPILNVQRALFAILSNGCTELVPRIKKQLFKSWLQSTKTARKSGNIQRSYNCLIEMNKIRESLPMNGTDSSLTDIENCEAIIESAKIQWNKNNNIAAIQYLKNQIERNYWSSLENCYKSAVNSLSGRFTVDELNEIRNSLSFGSSSSSQGRNAFQNQSNSSNNREDFSNQGFAKLQLLYAKYCDRSGVLDQNSLAVLYRSVKVAAPHWEESHYNLAMYCNKILMNYEESKRSNKSFSLGKPEEILEMKGRVVQSLVESLKYGVKHAHNSLPLMFNIWLDLGTDFSNYKNKSQPMPEEIRKTVEKMNNSINGLVANVPLFIFFTSFAQLTGRVQHPFGAITMILKRIIVKLICRFPQQSMWLLMRSIHSQNLNRKNCFKEILNQAVNEDKSLNQFVNDMLKFAKLMTIMCQKNCDSRVLSKANHAHHQKVKQMSLRTDFPEMAKLFTKNSDFSPILLPFRLLVNVTLPKSFYEKDYNPFPSKDIYIKSIDDCIELLHSLQKPKKIKINGTDGKTYTILCKPGDDLRKDYCLIEFCNLLNRCFKRDADSRRRQMKVKTYLVISLTDTCGLIEWIPDLTPFRTLVEDQYRLSGGYDNMRETIIRNYPSNINLSNAERIKLFQNKVLPQFKPPVLGNWFASTYSDPLSWFSARQAFTRSSAVFSIVGYLLGLGDRHGENILIEELTGETVHVDLNCMFNKGEDFGVPERVPFRLTHNMVHAMGVTEYEGTFRKACEHALRVARDNKEALLNFVNPFRYDHLIEWSRTNSQIKSTVYEQTIDWAERIVFNIDARLKGIPSRNDRNLPKGIPLSVEGQVDHIIKESTDINNLGVMYVGWAPYL